MKMNISSEKKVRKSNSMNLKTRRKNRIKNRIKKNSDRNRLSVFRSNKNIYVQVIDDITGKTIASASSLEKEFKSEKNVVNFDLGITDMISTASNKAFDRSTILMVLGIAFLKFF